MTTHTILIRDSRGHILDAEPLEGGSPNVIRRQAGALCDRNGLDPATYVDVGISCSRTREKALALQASEYADGGPEWLWTSVRVDTLRE